MEKANKELIFQALSDYDRTEGSDPLVLSWIKRVFAWATDARKVPWCGIYMAELCRRCCVIPPEEPALARNWLDVGRVNTQPYPGDIVVLWRGSPSSWQGHVGIFCRKEGDYVWVLGGNQSNRVCVERYAVERIIGYRTLYLNESTSAVKLQA